MTHFFFLIVPQFPETFFVFILFVLIFPFFRLVESIVLRSQILSSFLFFLLLSLSIQFFFFLDFLKKKILIWFFFILLYIYFLPLHSPPPKTSYVFICPVTFVNIHWNIIMAGLKILSAISNILLISVFLEYVHNLFSIGFKSCFFALLLLRGGDSPPLPLLCYHPSREEESTTLPLNGGGGGGPISLWSQLTLQRSRAFCYSSTRVDI